MAKGRYGCTNRKTWLPIADLDGARCPNSKTTMREELEDRVLSSLPVAFFSMNLFNKISEQLIRHEIKKLNTAPSRRDDLQNQLDRLGRDQRAIISQVRERADEGRPRLSQLDDTLDELELKKAALSNELEQVPTEAVELSARIAQVRAH
ncbi:hypothetical protein HGO38_12230 [Rhizobium sp. CG5]|uniref:hypothetical protein n=1 Tax=Rhizobium sp. CG5 TaxID=2726076 RepID=UPI002034691B|nr:hypothetical protein [Rhizobium sp. CG5]MCM2474241.1 hypothetical protein [Rhizobium sp. CG5]